MRLSPPLFILIFISLFAFSQADYLDVTLSSYEINKSGVTYTFGLSPGAGIFRNIAAGSTYKVTFPSDYTSIFPASGVTCDDGAGRVLSCSRSGQVFTVTNLFDNAARDLYFTVRILGLTNPSHSSSTGSFTATISGTGTTTITATQTTSITTGTSTCSITPASLITGVTTSWTFSITTKNAIPASGGLTIVPVSLWTFQTDNLLPTSTPTCSVTSPTAGTPSSCAVSSSGTLEVRSMNSAPIAAGAVLSITITGFRNPPMTASYSFTTTTLDANNLGIDSCKPAVTPTTPNALTVESDFFSCTTNQDLKTVNTYDTCVLTFKIKNPLPSGSSLSIGFPSTVGLSALTSVVLAPRSLVITGPSAANVISIATLVTSDTAAGTYISLRFAQILQPSTTKPTASFQISTSYNGFSIDTITSGATYSASAGALTSLSASSSPSTVGSSSASMTFSFVITDALSTSATLSIAFPSELTVATTSSASCTGSGSKIATGPICSIASSVLTVSSFATSALVSGDTITIRLNSAVALPSSTKPTSSFTIQTLDGGYAVDSSTSLAFSATAAGIVSGSVAVPDGSIVGDVSTYTFSFVNANPIPATGKIQITLPTDDSFAISDSTVIAQGVSVTVASNSATTVSSTVVIASSPNTITFPNPTGAVIAAGTTIGFTVPSIRNPLSTASSSSFTVSTLTSDGYTIDMKASGLAVVAGRLTAADFRSLTVTLSPSTTGSSSTYKFRMTSNIAQLSTNLVQITFPSTFTFASSVSCQVITSSSSGTVSSCTPSSSNVFSVALAQAVAAQTTFEVDITGVMNPTAATSYTGFSVYTQIAAGNLVNQRTSGISVTVTPSIITTASLARSTKVLSAAATYTFTLTPVNAYPSTAYIQMTVPSELVLSASPVCTGKSGISTLLTCTVSSTNSNQFTITGSTFYSSSSIVFSVDTITNQASQISSSSFTIYVFTADGLIIDQLTSGLVSESPCSSNCLTCSDSNRDYCLSCPASGNTLLNVPTHTCVATCSTGTYENSDSTQCIACNSNCLGCSGSATTCTSCDTTSTLGYLYNSECRTSCPDGYYGDSNKVCQACTAASHCKTCSSSSVCKSCNDNFFLLNGACGTSCDAGYYKDSSSWECKTCGNNCKTCDTATTCTGCDTTSLFPILFGTSCLKQCPGNYYQSGYDCIACESPCATCSGSSSFCLTCTGGLYPANGECKTCSTSCGSCVGSPTTCASCNNGLYLQGTTCVTSCSDGYFLDSGSATCKPCSSRCETCSALNKCTSCDSTSSYPYFYQGGETCVRSCPSSAPVVKNGACTASNTVEFVNPYDGIYMSGLPFPFIIFGAIFCGLVGVGKIINTNTLVTSNIIGFLGLLEFSTWIAMAILLGLSHPGDPVSDYVGLPIVIVAIVTSLVLNGFFYWRLVKAQIKSEQYVSWKKARKSHRISSIAIQTLSCVCFKTFRLVYSRFFGLGFMSANLEEPRVFLKRLHKYTGINFVISVLPALIAAIITLNEDSDNYPQLVRISVEVLVISLVLIIVSIYDGFKSNELDRSETGITAIMHGQVLSMIEKTIIDKLNESMESGKMKRPQSKLSAYRRRNSLNLDQSYEYNEGNSSFLNLNRTEKILTGVGMKHEESFNESVDGVIGRDAQGNAMRRVNKAIEEENDEDADEEPTLNMKNKTLGQLRDMLKDRGHDLEPEKIMIENKDGSVIVLRDKSSYLQNTANMGKSSPSKSQVSSIRGIDEEAGRTKMSKFVSEDEEFAKLTGRKGQPSSGRKIQEKAIEFDENGRPKYASPQSNHRMGTQGKTSEESEEELELHDSYGNLEGKFGKNSLQNSRNNLERGLENLSPIGRLGSRAMDHSPSRTIQNQMEDDQEEEELEVHSQTPSKTGPRQSGDDNHLRSSPGFAAKPPTGRKGNKSSAKKNPNERTPGKNNSKEDFEYVSSDSQLSVEDVHDHFQDDTPSNYDALNQRFDENLYQKQLVDMGKRPDSRATQNMSTRSIPKSHLPPVNEAQESHRRSGHKVQVQAHSNNYFSDGMEDGDLPPVRGKSIESVGSQKNSVGAGNNNNNNNNNGILQRHKNKVVPFATGGNASERSNSMGRRAMTPQHNINSRTVQTNSSRGFDTHNNSFTNNNKKELNQTVKNFHRAANQRSGGGSKVFDSQRERSSSREDTRRPGSVDRMKRLEGIYANKVIVPRLNKISSRGSNKVANSRGFIDDDMDNDGLEIHDFGKFESIVNGMKKQPTEEGDYSMDKTNQ